MARRKGGKSREPLDFETECPRCGTAFDVAATATEASCPSCAARLSLVEVDEAAPAPEPLAALEDAAEPLPAPAAAAANGPDFSRTIAIVPEPEPVADEAPEPLPEERPRVEVPVEAPRKKWKDPVLTAKGVQERRKAKGSSIFETPCPGCNTTLKVTEDARGGACPWCGMALEFEDVVESPGEEIVPEPVVEAPVLPAQPQPVVEPEELIAAQPPQPVTLFEAVDEIEPTPPPPAKSRKAPDRAPEPEPVATVTVASEVPEPVTETPKAAVPAIPITRETSPIVVVSAPPKEGPAPLEEVVGVTEPASGRSAAPPAPVRAPLSIVSEADVVAAVAPPPPKAKPAPPPRAPSPAPVAVPAAATTPTSAPSPAKPLTALEFTAELEASAQAEKAEQERKRRIPLPALPMLRRESESLVCPACRTEVPVPRGETAFQCPKCQQFLAAVDPAAAKPAPKPILPFLAKNPPAPKPVAKVETVEPVLARAAPSATPKAAPKPARAPLVVEDEVSVVAAPAKAEAPSRKPLLVEEDVELVAAPPAAPPTPKPAPTPAPSRAMVIEDSVELVPAAAPARVPRPDPSLLVVEDSVEFFPPAAKPAAAAKPALAPIAVEEDVVAVAAPVQAPKPKRFGFLGKKTAPEPVASPTETPSEPKKRFGLFGKKTPVAATPAPQPAPIQTPLESVEPEAPKPRFPLRPKKEEPVAAPPDTVEELVATPAAAEPAPKRRFGLFGRKKAGTAAPEPAPAAAVVADEPSPLERTRVLEPAPIAEPAVVAPPPLEPEPEPVRVVEPETPLAFAVEEEVEEIVEPPVAPPAVEPLPELDVPVEEPAPEPLPEPLPEAVPEPIVEPIPEPLPAAEAAEPDGLPKFEGPKEQRRGFFGRFRRSRDDEPVALAEAAPEPLVGRIPEPEPLGVPEATLPRVEPEPEPTAEPEPVAEPASGPEPEPLPAVERMREPEFDHPASFAPEPFAAEPLPEMPASGRADQDAFAPFGAAPPGSSSLEVPEALLLAPRDLHRRVDRVLKRRGLGRRAAAEVLVLRARTAPSNARRRAGPAPDPGVIVKTEGPRLVEADFTLLRGVGPKVADALRGAGYRTFGTLLKADAAKLALVLGLPARTVREWQRDADVAAVGLGDEEARWLRAVGVPTLSRLARASPRTVTRRIAAFARAHGLERAPGEATVAQWVAAAKRAPRAANAVSSRPPRRRARSRAAAKGKKGKAFRRSR